MLAWEGGWGGRWAVSQKRTITNSTLESSSILLTSLFLFCADPPSIHNDVSSRSQYNENT